MTSLGLLVMPATLCTYTFAVATLQRSADKWHRFVKHLVHLMAKFWHVLNLV